MKDCQHQTYQSWLHALWQEHHTRWTQQYAGLNESSLRRHLSDLILKKTGHSVVWQHQINLEHQRVLQQWLSDIQAGIPLAQILERAWFYEHSIRVNNQVLIPRPETEILVEQALAILKNFNNVVVADIGTGSGTIALSLARAMKERGQHCTMLASDISPDAIALAQWNSYLWWLENDIQFFVGDRLQAISAKWQGKLDMIVSNPPYIRKVSQRSMVHQQVLSHEPELALFLPDEEYSSWFGQFFAQIHQCLASGGYFFVEGHEHELENKMKQCQAIGFEAVELIKDYNGFYRFIVGRKK